MFKVLITTMVYRSDSCAVSTVVTEYETLDRAKAAIEQINKNSAPLYTNYTSTKRIAEGIW